MQSLFVSLILLLSSMFGIEKIPEDTGIWSINSKWVKQNQTWVLQASTSRINEICADGDAIVLPQVIHGIHRVYSDDNLVFQSGDPTFERTSAFYERGIVNCKYLSSAKTVTWSVTAYSQYFARIKKMPIATGYNNSFLFLDVILNFASASALIVLALFSLFIFRGRVANKFIISLAFGATAFAAYSILSCGNYWGLNLSMLTVHKLADIFVWLGSLAYFYFFRKFNYLGNIEFSIFCAAFFIGEVIIVTGTTGDVVQLGTTIPIPFAFICLASFLFHSLHFGIKNGFNKNNIFGIVSLFSLAFAATNDLLHILGVIDTNMYMPVGSVFGVFFLAAAANADIEKTYHERDDLVSNLQNKVNEQTKHLTGALEQVKNAQAELVHSARLASLGTLSAGIAHEINNAINFVNGAVIPLERKVMKSIPESDRVITEKLFAAIKEGTHLTVEIVRSLRNFTGLNQAKVKDVNIKETVTSVITILKSKLTHINLEINIRADLTLNCYQVGLNQIFMNLITNAVDVMPTQNGRIEVNASEETGDFIVISISDNGSGMSDEIKNRIFDPFFTTKDVGKGTGLGLHIVQKEVERHSGSIAVMSELNKGTTFTIKLPKNVEPKEIKDAA